MGKPSKVQKSGRSPYRKYDKTPYKYMHTDCNHNTSVRQSTKDWAGKVCTRCNIITAVG